MKRTFTKILSVVLCAVMVLGAAPLGGLVGLDLPSLFDFKAEALSYSGACGDNLTWSLDTSTGVLNITGTGAMKNWSSSSTPWYNYRSSIKTVNIAYGVTTIGDDAFAWCDSITSVTIGNSVTTIGEYAFYDCDSLTSVAIPDSVKTIGDDAFSSCDSLTSITVDINNKYYSSDSYGVLFNKDKTTLVQYPIGNTRTSYTIPDSVTTIGDRAFYECDSLTSITIGDSVTTIGELAFNECDSLTSVTIPDSVTSIGGYAFAYCGSLTSVTIPGSVTTIGYAAFHFCTSLTIVTIPDSVTSIGNYAFYSCESLTSVTIPDSVTTIGDSAFCYCTSLKGVTIGNSVTTIGDSAFYSCESLTSITIPDSVTAIGVSAFTYCDSLTSVTIPDSVTTIGSHAFGYCTSLTSVTIGNSVTTIGNYAFTYCTDLTDVYYTDTEEQWKKISIGFYNEYLTSAMIHYNYVPEEPDTPSTPENERKTRIIVNKGALNYFVGEAIVLVVTEEENGEYYTPDKITITNSDDSVAVLENIYSYSQFKGLSKFSDFDVPTEYRNSKFIVMTAKKSGMTAVTINDNTTKDTYTFPINVSVDDYVNLRANQIKTYDYKIPLLLVNDTYNAYYNGMYVADFSYKKVSGGWNFDMNIYNQTYVNGVVEVYDNTGNLVKVEIIDKYEGTGTGILETLSTGWSMITEAFKGDSFSFRGVSFSKESKIKDLFVPQDGYVKITNDSAVSTTCFVLNLFDLVLTGGSLIKDIKSFSELEIQEIEKELLGIFVASEYYLKSASKFQEKLTEKGFKNISEANLSTIVATLSGEAENLLMDIELNFDDVVKTALGTAAGIGEGILTQYAGVFGYSLAVIFTAQKVLNFTVQLDHWKDTAGNGNPFGFVTPLASSNNATVYSGDGIGVDTNGNAPTDIIVQTYKVLKDTITVELSTGEILSDYVAYDISLVKDGKVVQPNGTVTVHIPFPAEFEGSKIQIIRENEDGSWSLIDSTVEKGIITFEVNHFCLFVIAPVESTAVTYTLSYNANGGFGAPSSQAGSASYSTSSTKPVRSGYIFLGWSKSSIATSASYQPGDKITLSENTVLYAVWQKEQYNSTVSITNNNASRTINYGDVLRLTAITTDMPSDAKIYWFVDGIKKGEGETFDLTFESGTKTVEVKLVDSNDDILENTSGNEIMYSMKVTVNASFWQKIVSFFKNLFRMNRIIY